MPTSSGPAFVMRLSRKSIGQIGALVAILGMVGCAAPTEVARSGDKISPPTVGVTRNQAWKDAEALAAADPNRLTVIGAGASMRPVYGENTVLVLQKIPYESLTPGMNVAYRNQRGTLVLHRLVAKEAGGWRATGLNNPREDTDRVTPHNLLGIVYASFANEDVE